MRRQMEPLYGHQWNEEQVQPCESGNDVKDSWKKSHFTKDGFDDIELEQANQAPTERAKYRHYQSYPAECLEL